MVELLLFHSHFRPRWESIFFDKNVLLEACSSSCRPSLDMHPIKYMKDAGLVYVGEYRGHQHDVRSFSKCAANGFLSCVAFDLSSTSVGVIFALFLGFSDKFVSKSQFSADFRTCSIRSIDSSSVRKVISPRHTCRLDCRASTFFTRTALQHHHHA